MKNIRNFCIIAHIDHGKSTLADRMLEITHTVEKRKMMDQVLDSMELERERGITIKMQPVRMVYTPPQPLPKREGQALSPLGKAGDGVYILNLIDTPGHIDFSYEVSRALTAVEGVVLLVDSTQGVQAQTISVLNMAKEMNLTIIPALSKIDSPLARVSEIKEEIVKILGVDADSILEVSGRTGEGVEKLLQTIVERIPAPSGKETAPLSSLVFDFKYSTHQGISVFVRVVDGVVKSGESLIFRVAGEKFKSLEVGIFDPKDRPIEKLGPGEIGYIVTGIKSAGVASVGDTIGRQSEAASALPGYGVPRPVVWASIFPEDQGEFVSLKQALSRLHLSDSSLSYEEESSGILGKGFRCGCLGLLHLEIVVERLKREFNLNLIVTQPSINYFVTKINDEKEVIYSASLFPDDGVIRKIEEPWVNVSVITPASFVSNIIPLIYEHEAKIVDTEVFGDERSALHLEMPLRELMRSFFDRLKSVSSGYASISYEIIGMKEANVTRLDVLFNGEVMPAFSRVVSRRTVEQDAEKIADKLQNVMPRQMFEIKIQVKALGRIISSRTISAFRKDVTQHMYGGDITRKMKLREKQKKGKKKMKDRGKIDIPHDVFLKVMKPD